MGGLKVQFSRTILSLAVLVSPAFLALHSNEAQTGVQQTTVTTSTHVVVVLIPGFPIESIVSGILLGIMVVLLIRRRRRERSRRT